MKRKIDVKLHFVYNIVSISFDWYFGHDGHSLHANEQLDLVHHIL